LAVLSFVLFAKSGPVIHVWMLLLPSLPPPWPKQARYSGHKSCKEWFTDALYATGL
jgi:hypothetical protein